MSDCEALGTAIKVDVVVDDWLTLPRQGVDVVSGFDVFDFDSTIMFRA